MNENCKSTKEIQHTLQQAQYARDTMNYMLVPLINRAPWACDFTKIPSLNSIVDEVHMSINDAIEKLNKEIGEIELQLNEAEEQKMNKEKKTEQKKQKKKK
jgi:hypothetical protein